MKRCRRCAQPIRNPHVTGCGANTSLANQMDADALAELRGTCALPLPKASQRVDHAVTGGAR